MNHVANKPVFISWTAENGRSADLAEALDAELIHVYPSGGLLLRYIKSLVASRKILSSLQPSQYALFMLPPTPLAIMARLARGKHHTRNIYDLHTGFFYDPKWQWASSWTLRLMRGATAIVTNANLASVCARAGVQAHVLHDVLRPHRRQDIPGSHIVCPVSYSNDEPIDRILEAAGNIPETRWLLTGNAPANVRSNAPANVQFTGFLDDVEYSETIRDAALVVALTNRKDTMQRAGYEALMRGVPVVTSDFEVLRDFFQDAAVYVAEGEFDLEDKVREAMSARSHLAERTKFVFATRVAEQEEQLGALRNLINA